MYDTVGQAVVPITTKDGFKVQVNGAGKLAIGIGRAYVDGILVECFGDISDPAKTVRDDNIGGVVGSGPVEYTKQPFYYQPKYPDLSTKVEDVNLVYLDVWQREVTVYQDPSLREPALNGPDTDNRIQTAWQVKVLQGADTNSCETPPATWGALIAASTARLSATATPAPPAPGPCVINPAGGAGEPALPGRDPPRRHTRGCKPGPLQVVARQRIAGRHGDWDQEVRDALGDHGDLHRTRRLDALRAR